MQGKVKLKVDTKALDSLMENIMFAVENSAKVGHADSDQHSGSGMSMAELGYLMHEGGVGDEGNIIPARPYLKDTMIMNQQRMDAYLRDAAELVLSNSDSKRALETVAKRFEVATKELISSGHYIGKTPNARMTQDLKGSDIPLIDTGDFVHGITSGVTKK